MQRHTFCLVVIPLHGVGNYVTLFRFDTQIDNGDRKSSVSSKFKVQVFQELYTDVLFADKQVSFHESPNRHCFAQFQCAVYSECNLMHLCNVFGLLAFKLK